MSLGEAWRPRSLINTATIRFFHRAVVPDSPIAVLWHCLRFANCFFINLII